MFAAQWMKPCRHYSLPVAETTSLNKIKIDHELERVLLWSQLLGENSDFYYLCQAFIFMQDFMILIAIASTLRFSHLTVDDERIGILKYAYCWHYKITFSFHRLVIIIIPEQGQHRNHPDLTPTLLKSFFYFITSCISDCNFLYFMVFLSPLIFNTKWVPKAIGNPSTFNGSSS